jgi:EpsI family protein
MNHPGGSVRAAAVAIVFVATYALTQANGSVPAPPPPALDAIPLTLASWTGEAAPPLAPDVAKVLAADQYVHRYYRGPGGAIEMDVAYYAQPRVGATMHSPLNCLPGNGWKVAQVNSTAVTTSAGEWTVRNMIVERDTARFAMTYWFQSRNRIVSDELSTRFYLLADALRRRPTDAGLVRLMMPVAGSAAAAEQATLTAFAVQLIPALNQHLN